MAKPLYLVVAVLIFCALVPVVVHLARTPHSMGLMVQIGPSISPAECQDKFLLQQPLVLRISNDHTFRLNNLPLANKNDLRLWIDRIYRDRLKRELYVLADQQIAFQDVADTLGTVNELFPDMHFYLVTPAAFDGFCLNTIRNVPAS